MVHFFDPIGHAIRVGKQLGERQMIGADLKLMTFVTLLPVRLMSRPANLLEQIPEVVITILQATVQIYFNHGVARQLQRIRLTLRMCTQG